MSTQEAEGPTDGEIMEKKNWFYREETPENGYFS